MFSSNTNRRLPRWILLTAGLVVGMAAGTVPSGNGDAQGSATQPEAANPYIETMQRPMIGGASNLLAPIFVKANFDRPPNWMPQLDMEKLALLKMLAGLDVNFAWPNFDPQAAAVTPGRFPEEFYRIAATLAVLDSGALQHAPASTLQGAVDLGDALGFATRNAGLAARPFDQGVILRDLAPGSGTSLVPSRRGSDQRDFCRMDSVGRNPLRGSRPG